MVLFGITIAGWLGWHCCHCRLPVLPPPHGRFRLHLEPLFVGTRRAGAVPLQPSAPAAKPSVSSKPVAEKSPIETQKYEEAARSWLPPSVHLQSVEPIDFPPAKVDATPPPAIAERAAIVDRKTLDPNAGLTPLALRLCDGSCCGPIRRMSPQPSNKSTCCSRRSAPAPPWKFPNSASVGRYPPRAPWDLRTAGRNHRFKPARRRHLHGIARFSCTPQDADFATRVV